MCSLRTAYLLNYLLMKILMQVKHWTTTNSRIISVVQMTYSVINFMWYCRLCLLFLPTSCFFGLLAWDWVPVLLLLILSSFWYRDNWDQLAVFPKLITGWWIREPHHWDALPAEVSCQSFLIIKSYSHWYPSFHI